MPAPPIEFRRGKESVRADGRIVMVGNFGVHRGERIATAQEMKDALAATWNRGR